MARRIQKHPGPLDLDGRRPRALGAHPQGVRPADVAVVFDLGGVVIRWRNGPTYRRLATRLDLPFRSVENALESTSPALLAGRLSGAQFWDRVGRRLGCRIPAELRSLWAEDFARDARIDPQILRWIGRLRATGVRVACLSNNIVWHARVLRSRGWLREFSPALLSHEIGAAKPSRAAYDRARIRIGLPARNLLLVDDLWANVVGARRAGWGAIRFRGFGESRRRVDRWLLEAEARRSVSTSSPPAGRVLGRSTGPRYAGRVRVPAGPSLRAAVALPGRRVSSRRFGGGLPTPERDAGWGSVGLTSTRPVGRGQPAGPGGTRGGEQNRCPRSASSDRSRWRPPSCPQRAG